ncbi:hypothetical protein EJB05_16236, partial [Eragrostis curvula]
MAKVEVDAKKLNEKLEEVSKALEALAKWMPTVDSALSSLSQVVSDLTERVDSSEAAPPLSSRRRVAGSYLRNVTHSYSPTWVRIGYATKLKVLGYLEPSIHQLVIGGTVIGSGTKMTPSTMVPSVKILAIKVRFGVRKEAKMLPTFLRCFPNVETLHVELRSNAVRVATAT